MSGQNSQAVVRLKDSAPPINWREATAADSRLSFHEELDLNDQTAYSYQQISCLDSVIRYTDKTGHFDKPRFILQKTKLPIDHFLKLKVFSLPKRLSQ